MGLARVQAAGLEGVNGFAVDVQAWIYGQTPFMTVVGLPDAALRESRDRVRAAIRSGGYKLPAAGITVNLTPARQRKGEGAAFDLPIALAVLAALDAPVIEPGRLARVAAIGELTLAGEVRPVCGALAVGETLAERGEVDVLLVPQANAEAAALGAQSAGETRVIAVSTLAEAVGFLNGVAPREPVVVDSSAILAAPSQLDELDVRDVRGAPAAKRALLVAAAGGHDLLLVGPPGTGKTMLARRLGGLLPPLALPEVLEVSRVHAITRGGGPDEVGLVRRRPFRAPHHTASYAALVGGGTTPRPGEISLAHRGVLFLDELPEFSSRSLEALREPLESRTITICRATGTVTFPADFQLVAAMNPCPCGYLGDTRRRCSCPAFAAERYQARISGPLFDRIDLRAQVRSTPIEVLQAAPSEDDVDSATLRARASEARALQGARSGCLNARLSARELVRYLAPTAAGKRALTRLGKQRVLSGRGLAKVQRLARTLADLEGRARVNEDDVASAMFLRADEQQGAAA